MARIPFVSRDMVPDEFRGAFDEVTADTGGAITNGPGSITLNSPEFARVRGPVTNYLRYQTTFPKRIQELAILTTARAMDCQYIWNAHAPAGRQQGLSDALVDAIRDKKALPDVTPEESAVIAYGREFFSDHKVSQATFQKALDLFGAQHLVELTALMGHYSQTAFFLNAFEVNLPDQRAEPVLPV